MAPSIMPAEYLFILGVHEALFPFLAQTERCFPMNPSLYLIILPISGQSATSLFQHSLVKSSSAAGEQSESRKQAYSS